MASKRRIESDDSHSEEDGAKFNNQDEEFTVGQCSDPCLCSSSTCFNVCRGYN